MRRRLSWHRARSALLRQRGTAAMNSPPNMSTTTTTISTVTTGRIRSVPPLVDDLAAHDGHDNRRRGDVVRLRRVEDVPRQDDEIGQLAGRDRAAVALLEPGKGTAHRVGLDRLLHRDPLLREPALGVF